MFSFVLEIIGTVSFAISGVFLAIKKKFDLFGILILGIITAVGGGVIRDLTLGITPPMMFKNPIFCLTAALVSLIICIPIVRKFLHQKRVNMITTVVMDSIGLAVFTVNGIIYSAELYPESTFLLVFTGVITGVGGGVLRDVLAGRLPYIFTKHIYASASLAGALLYVIIDGFVPNTIAAIIAMLLIIIIRFISAYFKLELPHVNDEMN